MGLVTEKTEVAYLKSFLCIVVKKTFQVTSCYFVACRHLRDDDFTICPRHRCWVPKEVSGHCNSRVKPIPKADKGIGKRVSQVVLKMSENSYSLAPVSRLLTTVSNWELVNTLPEVQTDAEFLYTNA